jgi:hypothetical protein
MVTLCTRCAACLLPARYSRGWGGRLTGGEERGTGRRRRREEMLKMLQPSISRRVETD